MADPDDGAEPDPPWLTPGVRGIGFASLLADLGHEIPTALLPSFLTTTLGAPAAALGVIEGLSDALSGIAKFAGGPLADDPSRRRSIAVGGYTVTAILSSSVGLAGAVWQVGVLRAAAWTARGIRGPARNALMADAVDAKVYGRAYGFERAMDNAGAVGGPLLALALVSIVGVREAILLSIVPGLLAALAIVYAIRHLHVPKSRSTAPIRLVVRPLLRGRLGRLLMAVSLFEAGNVAATLLILRTTDLLTAGQGLQSATTTAILLYTGYNLAATLASIPAGRVVDRRGGRFVFGVGVALFGVAYLVFAAGGPVVLLAAGFLAAGIGSAMTDTAESASVALLAPAEQRGSAFGLLAAIQSVGDLIASATVGLVWTLVSPGLAFVLAASVMGAAVVALVATSRGDDQAAASAPGIAA